ncbi:MAG TPA: cupin domain-containing protein [Syntrophorhabdaceae bacterium]|nr:cupin domain-containing protein [Syntrophorhabdaceae bacterium]HOL05943.1 cupin domain-containing protein [Syntrophorhabdaceae bacterium]HON86266.1 cupin domain-containing protein [Syntrophorhabdaceae bacterium]HOT41844.1 cupin domain-containing protein [Syntrophorhabdaceae bacterium]HPC67565.1 cupin domain-containing protein [Syntrophorhabdaceae bacterium]
MDKVYIEKLPYTKEVEGAKRWDEEKGEFVQVSYKQEIWHLAYFELKKGFFRGNHYHEKKEEFFYIIEGRIKAVFLDMDTHERKEHVLEKGERIHVKTRCGHIFIGVEDSRVIEYSPQVYDKEDNFKVDLGV